MRKDQRMKRQIERIVLGQTKHTLHEHPEFFTDRGKRHLPSIAKRISGDVNAYMSKVSRSCKVGEGE